MLWKLETTFVETARATDTCVAAENAEGCDFIPGYVQEGWWELGACRHLAACDFMNVVFADMQGRGWSVDVTADLRCQKLALPPCTLHSTGPWFIYFTSSFTEESRS